MLLILPLSAEAATFKSGPSIYVGKNETIQDNFYVAGNTINIDGNIIGDLICAGGNVNINGKIEGDLICAAQSLTINGEVTGNVRAAGSAINLNNRVGKSANVFSGFTNISSNAQIGQDLVMGSGMVEVRGRVGRDLVGGVGNIVIASEIGDDVRLWVDQNVRNAGRANPLIITREAKINDTLTYTSKQQAEIMQGATVNGEIKHMAPKEKDKGAGKAMAAFYGWWRLVSLFSALVVGLVLVSLWGEQIVIITDVMLERPLPSFGWGLVILFLTPILLIFLMITLIGFPLALIIGALWMIAIYTAKIVVAILLGRWLLKNVFKRPMSKLILPMILGVVIFWIVCSIPVLGWILCLLATIWGLGGLWLYFRRA